MKPSQWKSVMLRLLDGVRCEVNTPVPALAELRARIIETDPAVPETRERLEQEMEALFNSQRSLRQAAESYTHKYAREILDATTAGRERVALLMKRHPEIDPEEHSRLRAADAQNATNNAESILPGQAAPEGKSDPRWQAIMQIGDFVEEEPDEIWRFILRWGVSDDADLRAAIGVLLLERLLEHHFVRFFALVEETARKNPNFADTFLRCWKLGQAEEQGNSERFEVLQSECKRAGNNH
jgi:hypothetical protein